MEAVPEGETELSICTFVPAKRVNRVQILKEVEAVPAADAEAAPRDARLEELPAPSALVCVLLYQ